MRHLDLRTTYRPYRAQADVSSIPDRCADHGFSIFAHNRTEHASLVGAIMGMFVNGLNGGIGAIISEAYPTVARATAQNTLWNLGRAVGSVGPLAVGALATKYSFHAAIGLLALIYFLDIVATLFLIPEFRGKELE